MHDLTHRRSWLDYLATRRAHHVRGYRAAAYHVERDRHRAAALHYGALLRQVRP